MTPTSPVPAFKLGERTNDPLQMYLADIYTVTDRWRDCRESPFRVARLAESCRLDCSLSDMAFGEAKVLQLANAFESAGGGSV